MLDRNRVRDVYLEAAELTSAEQPAFLDHPALAPPRLVRLEPAHLVEARVRNRQLRADFGSLKGKHIALWGLAFKPKTDDVREAPAFALIEGLLKEGATVTGTDPEAMQTAQDRLNFMGATEGVTLTADAYEACKDADALVLCTEWREFTSPNIARLKGLLRGRRVYDGRNVWVPAEFTEAGFEYRGIGRS